MLRYIFTLILFLFSFSFAKIKVATTYPYIADITQKIAKDKANVISLANGNLDPHFITPKPSLIVKLRDADLLIINGAHLEIGWLPPLIRQANNPKINPNTNGFLDLSNFVELIQKPENVSRAGGDVHPEGNPHFHLNPNNIPIIADAITQRLCEIDNGNCGFYKQNLNDFKKQFSEKKKIWDEKMKSLKGSKVYEYHRLYDYFLTNYQIIVAGTLEPLPGIPPTSKHLQNLIENSKDVKFILQDVYHSQDSAKFVSSKTGIPVIILPHDVGAVPEAKDIFSLFDIMVERLTR